MDKNNNQIFDAGEGVSQFEYVLDAQGRKLSAVEKFWIDINDDDVLDEIFNNVRWSYDNAGRLIYEEFDHYDDEYDQTSEWLYDLVGNRLQQTVNGKNTLYDYDANDRLLTEISGEKKTVYGYDHTQQTSKIVTENGEIVSTTTYEYDVQGRMSVVTITTGNRTEITKYEYGADGIRVSAEHEIYIDGELQSKTRTEYLNDPKSLTGYSQVLRQTEYDAEGNVIKTISYVIGHQRISQTIEINGEKTEYYFTFDGHGSTRVLLDLAGAVVQMYAFDAYGNAIGFNTSEALTEFLYSGEQFDSKIGQQYLRQRYYDPITGRFNRLDPFFGNQSDPQSFHKYLYAHANPVNGYDPSGNFAIFSPLFMILGGTLIGYGVGGTWDTALFGGMLGLGVATGSPLALAISLFVGFNLPWNTHRNQDYRVFFRTLMEQKEREYDSNIGFIYNYDTPSQAFMQFRGGIGGDFSRAYYFGDCPMTKAMRDQEKMYEIRGNIAIRLVLHDISGNHTVPTFRQLNDGGEDYLRHGVTIERIFYDSIIFATELIMSQFYDSRSDEWESMVLTSILGSFTYNYEIKSVNWDTKTAVVRFRVVNAMGRNTATRIPWTEDDSILGDQSTGPLADVTQFFLWDEEIKF